MKKYTGILIILSILILLLVSCTKIETKQKNNDPVGTPVTGVTSGDKPPVVNLTGSNYIEGVLVIGYSDKAQAMKAVKLLDGKIRADLEEINALSFKFNGTVKRGIEEIKELMKNDGDFANGISYIEPSYKRELIKPKKTSVMDNNSRELGMELNGFNWGSKKVNAPELHAQGIKGKDIIVAVIDTGIDETHPEFKGRCVDGYSPLEGGTLAAGSDNTQPDQTADEDHGTHCAGTILAAEDNKGITGIAPEAKLMNVRIFDAGVTPGSGKAEYIGDDLVAAGILWAVSQKANVLSNSFGGKDYSNIMHYAINNALFKNVVVVVSAGNNHTDEIHYPSCYAGVINVGATTVDDKETDFSTHGEWVTLAAPGKQILSTLPMWAPDFRGMPYGFMDGTSMAAPHVSGVVALLLSKLKQEAKTWTPFQIKQMLIKGSVDVMETGFDNGTGWGRIDALASSKLDITTMPKGGRYIFDIASTRKTGKWINKNLKLPENIIFPIVGSYATLSPTDHKGPTYYGKSVRFITPFAQTTFREIEQGKYDAIISAGEDSFLKRLDGVHTLQIAVNKSITVVEKSSLDYIKMSIKPVFEITSIPEGTAYKMNVMNADYVASSTDNGNKLEIKDTDKAGNYDISVSVNDKAAKDLIFKGKITYVGTTETEEFDIKIKAGESQSATETIFVY